MTNTPEAMAVEFLHYHRWANLKLMDACMDLTVDQLASSVPGVYGSVYDTLVHIIRSEAGYVALLTGSRLDLPFLWEDTPSLAEIRPYAQQVSSALVRAAAQMQFTDVIQQEWQGQTFRYRAVTLLIQALNHGIEHRTNITTILSQQGIQPPDLDGWDYMKSNPDRMGG